MKYTFILIAILFSCTKVKFTPVEKEIQIKSATTLASQSVISLTLINADTDQDIGFLTNGQTLNLSTLPTRNLNVRANTNPAIVGSVRFAYDANTNFRTENTAPYAFAANAGSDYFAWTPLLGSHTIKATDYSGANASGTIGTSLTVNFSVISGSVAGNYTFSVSGKNIYLNGKNFKIIGLRCSNALISDTETNELINNLNIFKSYGVNTISVYIMGSRFGNIKGYNPDASLNITYSNRLGRIIEAANARGMVILVGCLYWDTSTANDDLGSWNQTTANKAISNTIKWLKSKNYRNVFVDPDNEGMATRFKGWNFGSMISAANLADPSYIIGYNNGSTPPSNADILLHFSPKDGVRPWVEAEGTPTNATGGYWGGYSKLSGYYNYIRIGRYTSSMKTNQLSQSYNHIDNYQGHMLASTWLQCVPNSYAVSAPYMRPGGLATSDVNATDLKAVKSDSGILWWLNAMKSRYGAWNP